ncbi:MAG: polysaccharide deacetylase family protein [Andreesenia angusta]|nr:polysaccharide deacetylase family protein [Andreesenia angusta]
MRKKMIYISIILLIFLAIIKYTDSADIEIIPILTYHNIEPNPPMKRISYSIDDKKFENHIEYLKKKGYSALSLDEFSFKISNKNRKNKMKLSDQKDIMITIDDGKKNNYLYALPVLKKYNTKANIFIIGHRLIDIDKDYMVREDIERMIDSKLIEIGSHSYDLHYKNNKRAALEKKEDESHIDYNRRLRTDILKSKEILEKNFNIKINSFAYPYGIYNDEAIIELKKAGMDFAFTTEYGAFKNDGHSSNYKIQRINIDGLCSEKRLLLQIEFFKRLAVLKYKLNL